MVEVSSMSGAAVVWPKLASCILACFIHTTLNIAFSMYCSVVLQQSISRLYLNHACNVEFAFSTYYNVISMVLECGVS